MAIILCPACGRRMITQEILTSHLAKTHPDFKPTEEPLTEGDTTATPVSEPEATPAPQPQPIGENITLRFSQPVEITINGVKYEGQVVEAPNMPIASEIVRIAREAYGRSILE